RRAAATLLEGLERRERRILLERREAAADGVEQQHLGLVDRGLRNVARARCQYPVGELLDGARSLRLRSLCHDCLPVVQFLPAIAAAPRPARELYTALRVCPAPDQRLLSEG